MTSLTLTPWPVVDLLLTALLVLGGTLRLSRLVTTDSLGSWLLRAPLERWAADHERKRRAAIREVIAFTPEEGLTPSGFSYLADLSERLDSDDPLSWQARLVSGLSCPFCVGFWIGAAVLVATVLLAPLGIFDIIWLTILTALTLNYLAAHISAKLD